MLNEFDELEKRICTRAADFLCGDRHKPDSNEYKIVKYYIHYRILTLIKMIPTFAISACLGVFWHHLIFSIVYATLRRYSYGFHLKHALSCWVLGAVTYFGSILISTQLILPIWLHYLLAGLMIVSYICYAPGESQHMEIKDRRRNQEVRTKKEVRKRLKYISVLLSSLMVTVQIAFHLHGQGEFAMIVLCGMGVQAIGIIPAVIDKIEERGQSRGTIARNHRTKNRE